MVYTTGCLIGSFSSSVSALGVVFVPQDEDLGYITLEAMLASKPVIVSDSGGPLGDSYSQGNRVGYRPNSPSFGRSDGKSLGK